MNDKKLILIVDDDKSILRMLEFGLKKLGSDYQFYTAHNIYNAMEQVEQKWFDLVITDYMMPGMTGVDLARAVRRISPETQVVLMTAYGSAELRHTLDNLGIDGFLNKPFTMDQIREVVLQSVKANSEHLPSVQLEANPTVPDTKNIITSADSVDSQLQKLLVDAGVRGAMLISSDGYPVQIVGQIASANSDSICALIAANFYYPTELSDLLGNQQHFKSSFYEGDANNLYVCKVNGKYLLAVLFDVKLRPGVVWFYTKQAAMALATLLK